MQADRALLVGLLTAIVVGCSNAEQDVFLPPHIAKSHYEAATTHVAVLAVAPWADYADALQPQFRLSGEDALNKTLPTTLLLSNQLLDVFNASLRVGLPTSTLTSTETATSNLAANAVTPSQTRNFSETAQTGPGSLPAAPPNAAEGRKLPELINAGALSAQSLQREPVLQYQTATALFQEVQLLNRYIKDAVRRTNFTPYIVRLQVTVLPNARNEPYDVTADVSFLPPQKDEPAFSPGIPKNTRDTVKAAGEKEPNYQTPTVVPLLVTDNAELSLEARAVEVVRQLGLALGGTVQNVALQLDGNKFIDQAAKAQGNSVNALSTIGRLNDSTIRLRIGAANQGSTRFSMLPRANTLTLLVLVPDKSLLNFQPAFVPIALKTYLRDATTGVELPEITNGEFIERQNKIKNIAYKYLNGQTDQVAIDTIKQLSQYTVTNDYNSFVKEVGHKVSSDLLDSLWVELGPLKSGYGYSTTLVPLPAQAEARLPALQTALLLDDATGTASARLVGAAGFLATDVRAILTLNDSGKTVLPASRIERAQNDLVLTFASPALWGVAPKAGAKAGMIEVALPTQRLKGTTAEPGGTCLPEVNPDVSGHPLCSATYVVAYRAKAKDPDPGFEYVSTFATVTPAKDNTGTYRFAVKLAANRSVTVKADGALITAVTPATEMGEDFAWKVTGSGLITVTLAQLVPGQRFKIKLNGDGGVGREIDVTVAAPPREEKEASR